MILCSAHKTIEGAPLSDKYFRPPLRTRNFLEEVEKNVHADQAYIEVESPYDTPLPAVLSSDNIERELREGFYDKWGRKWIFRGYHDIGDDIQSLIFIVWISPAEHLVRFAKRLLRIPA